MPWFFMMQYVSETPHVHCFPTSLAPIEMLCLIVRLATLALAGDAVEVVAVGHPSPPPAASLPPASGRERAWPILSANVSTMMDLLPDKDVISTCVASNPRHYVATAPASRSLLSG